jgi:elongation factor P--(R)-beta-lysine ligase
MASDFQPSASLAMLRRRAELLAKVRRFFDERSFLEVETPLLSHDVVVDRHLEPLSTRLFSNSRRPAEGKTLWLQTSPEFGMKRLLAAYGSGPDSLAAIYQITRAFRDDESGPWHNPEFTMVEWYRVGDDYEGGMQLLADLAEETIGRGPAEWIAYREAFRRYADIDPFDAESSIPVPPGLPNDADRDMVLDYLLTTQVEPHLGQDRPTIMCDYPASQAALSQVRDGNPPVAERFELYFRGMELANGYHELLNPSVLRSRNRTNNQLRALDGTSVLPEESRLLAAMEHGLPSCSGCALGFDRLVMVVTGATTIQEVMAFPIDRA